MRLCTSEDAATERPLRNVASAGASNDSTVLSDSFHNQNVFYLSTIPSKKCFPLFLRSDPFDNIRICKCGHPWSRHVHTTWYGTFNVRIR